ncbi:MAG: gliding motility lipoprotein GldD, partial [Flavobacteriales bacterium]|nr:gliding motility lipoprotein GldD [Flavobacteriales bacterium]
YLEDSRSLAYKHTVKAYAIDEKLIINDSNKVFGTIYALKGDVASSYQFHATDSSKHFIRGSLYYEIKPNQDSLQPLTSYIVQDLEHLIQNIIWK